MALRRFQLLPLEIVDGDIEKPEKRRQGWLQRSIEGQQLARDFLADPQSLIARPDLEVSSKQVDKRKKRRRLAIGDGAALHDKPALRCDGTG